MPNNKSAKKRVKSAERKATYNKSVRTALKSQIKKAETALESGDADKASVLNETVKIIDKATAKGLLHKNTAARKKSALAKKASA